MIANCDGSLAFAAAFPLQLQHQALLEIAGCHSGGLELLDGGDGIFKVLETVAGNHTEVGRVSCQVPVVIETGDNGFTAFALFVRESEVHQLIDQVIVHCFDGGE